MNIYERQKLEKERFIFLIRTVALIVFAILSFVYMGGTLHGIIRTAFMGAAAVFMIICYVLKKSSKGLSTICLVLMAGTFTWLFLSCDQPYLFVIMFPMIYIVILDQNKKTSIISCVACIVINTIYLVMFLISGDKSLLVTEIVCYVFCVVFAILALFMTNFMEKQANRGAYGLMMPETHTRELIRTECRNAENYRHVGEKFELAGIAIGKTLHLPHFRIRARMVQLGNIEAKGALNYIRKDKIEPFAFDRDSWREEQHTFVIDELTVNALRRTNPDFEQVMKSGRFVYADGHVILNDPKYVKRGKDDKFVLTDEALKHVDDCCLRFVRLYVQQNVGRYVYGRLYYDSDLQKRTEFYLSDYINQKQMSLPDADGR